MTQKGFLPPNATDLEEVVLGSLMIERNAIESVADILTPEMFYKEAHEVIYRAILGLYQSSEPIDLMTVANAVRKTGKLESIGGSYFITSLTNRVGSTANIKVHSRIIYDKYLLRELISLSQKVVAKSLQDDADSKEIIEEAENKLSTLYGNLVGSNVSGEIRESLKEIHRSFDNPSDNELTGLDTGNDRLNSITGGLQNGDLIVLAARPGVGKSARALKIAASAWRNQKKKGILFSLEMTKKKFLQRLISEASNFKGHLFKHKHKATEADLFLLTQGIGTVAQYGIEVYDKPAINVNFIRSVAKKFIKTHGDLGYIIVDYLQLMTVPSDKKSKIREQEVAEISKSLKVLAKELDVPVIALAQLSRELEKRADKRPIPSDLRESGSIEQDADLLWFLYSPSNYYEYDKDPDYGKGEDLTVTKENYEFLIENLIAKNRDGESKDAVMEAFRGDVMTYTSWEEEFGIKRHISSDNPFSNYKYEEPKF